MKICIFLIILLGFIRISFCFLPINVTEENVCPFTWFRRKRADGEYTRWRSNMETTAEFIVKVLDDDVTPGSSTKLAAVNIKPVTRRPQRIIIGGAMMPTTVATTATILAPEYTRFVPPTGGTTDPAESNKPYLETTPPYRDAFLPIRNNRVTPYDPLSAVRKGNRDDSPPGSPQFLPRTPARSPVRQYAPIAPVTFTRITTGTPLTPLLHDYYYSHPTRTPAPLYPTRTMGLLDKLEKLEDFPIFDAIIADDDTRIVVTRTSTERSLVRTKTHLTTESGNEEINGFFRKPAVPEDQGRPQSFDASTPQFFTKMSDGSHELDEKEFVQRKHNADTEKDMIYNNMFFYNIDYKDNVESGINNITEVDDAKTEVDDALHKKNASKADLQSDLDISSLDDLEESEFSENKTDYLKYPKTLKSSIDRKTERVIPKVLARISGEVVSRDKRHPVCNLVKLRPLSFISPRSLPEIVDQLRQWTEDSPMVKWTDMTGGNLTTMDNPIYVMTVDDPSVGQVTAQKQNVLLISGISGRDHYAVSSAMYVLYQLIERSETHKDLLKKYRFLIIPVFNPDGYDYSFTFPHRRDWFKNLRQTWELCKGRESCQYCSTHGIRCTVSPCYGVNLDRNFEYQWISPDELRAAHPCGNLYAGLRQMSEVETQALDHYIQSQRIFISVFIAFKEGEVLGVMYPYSHTKKKRAFDELYRQRAKLAAEAASSIIDRKYIAGQNSEFLPLYAGGIEDWADGHLGIDNTYTIMMFRQTDLASAKFLAERVIHEAYAAMDSLLLSNLPGRSQPLTLTAAEASSLHSSLSVVLLTSLAIFVFS